MDRTDHKLAAQESGGMKVSFIVHRASAETVRKPIEYDGETVTAEIPSLEVELTAADAGHGSLTLRYVGQAAKDAALLFRPGVAVDAEFSAVESA
jgi:hypothetical protein